jgi:hypothetical protein
VVRGTATLTGVHRSRLYGLDLGAVEEARWLDCHILRAPGGRLLCVVPIHTDPDFFAAHARTWP